ncbi:hypothetical protein LVJ94_33730 [Pendulispora rubella]|uniref:Exo-1,4-beta-D-glucosaminidase n=1 Tax=Pendulispora rubella TaxID=2741070 RepID=A0ABZ2KT40_9BACT
MHSSTRTTALCILGVAGFALVLLHCRISAESAGDAPAASTQAAVVGDSLRLQDGWSIRSSAEETRDGAALSRVGVDASHWLPTRVPSTVVAAQVAHGDLPDPYFGTNLRNIPGSRDFEYQGKTDNASFYDMEDTNPYKVPWWYRTEFELPAGREHVWLHFDGINYRANIWLNGQKIAGDDDVAGSYRRYDLDVTEIAKRGRRNALAVQVYAPRKNDLAPSHIDWHPMAGDKNMGIWQDVYVTSSGPVTVRSPFVVSRVPDTRQARLTVNAEVTNVTGAPLTTTLDTTIDDIHVSETVSLAAHETKKVSLTPEEHEELVLDSPDLWWPYQLGTPTLHDLTMTATVEGRVSDRAIRRFGIREVTMTMVDGKWARYAINGTPLMIRGAGYNSEILFRFSNERDEREMRLVKDMGLNTIRLEGKLANDHLFDVTDREGILVMAGWECCSVWEYWRDDGVHDLSWNRQNYQIAAASLESQLLRLRGRPSVISWLYGSDSHPPEDIEKMYLGVIRDTPDGVFWDDLGMTDNDVVEVTYEWTEEGDPDPDGNEGMNLEGARPFRWLPARFETR